MAANINTARAFISAGNFLAAKKLIDGILQAQPENPLAHALLIDLEFKCGNIREARRLCDAALARWPDNADIRLNHILTQIPRKPWLMRCWQVRKMIKRWAHDFPDRREEALFIEAVWALRSNWPGRARRLREQIAENVPDASVLNILDRMIAGAFGNTGMRETAAREGLSIDARDAAAHYELAYAQFEQCEFFAARRSAKAALAADPTNRRPAGILTLTWLMLFPPFLLKHCFTSIPDLFKKHVRSRLARFALWVGLLIGALNLNVGWLDMQVLVVFLALFLAWEFVRAAVMLRYRRGRPPREVKLARY